MTYRTFFMVAGSILQSVKSIRFHLIWDFNYNAVYHLFVLLFVLFLWKGIQRADAEEMEK